MMFLSFQLVAQEKYALIINAYSPSHTDGPHSWEIANPTYEPYYEFWNDVYLMWEMLYLKGFTDENIYVLYNKGYDFQQSGYNQRYTAQHHYLPKITDFAATEGAVDSVFTGLANGFFGFPQIQEDDFFVLYTFGHGSTYGIRLQPFPPYEQGSLSWEDLADYLNSLNCHRNVVVMQQCFSGSSINFLEDTNTIVLTAANDSMYAYTVDTLYFDDIDYPGDPDPGNQYLAYEREQYPGDMMKYRHGEFNFHLFNAIKRVDPGNQSVYYQTGYDNFPLNNADANDDNYTSLAEAYNWIREYDSRMRYMSYEHWDDPQLSDLGDISSTTTFEYPTIIYEDINENQSKRGIIGITKDIHVTTGNQLQFKSNSVIYLLNEAKLIIDAGASLVLEDNTSVFGTNSNNQIEVNGVLEVGQNVAFTSTGSYWDLYLINNEMQAVFNNTTFEKCELNSYCSSLNISNSTFNDCNVANSYRGNVTVTYTTFNNTWLYLADRFYGSFTATVNNCNFFNNEPQRPGIDLWYYDKFFITNNIINGFNNGIQIFSSGNGISGNQNICENEIYNSSCSGLCIYTSTASIGGNYIHNNNYGIRLFNNCNIALYGNPGATTYAETQQITDNDSYEVYASQYSFPWYFRNNVIIDEDNAGNPNDPMVYHYYPFDIYRDVRYNCWGNNFNPAEDFYPVDGYNYLPVWCPSGGKDTPVPGSDEAIYTNAKDLFEADFYAQAKDSFQLLINQYPESHYSLAAMKDLFALEKFVANNYNSLMLYYRTNDSIQTDSSLAKLGDFMANKCDVKLENWQTAIYWYEDVIQNPESTEDSIFAIIDLGYTYFLMNNSGNKAGYTGKMLEHIPKSMKEFREKRDYLLSLLPVDKKNHALENSLKTLKAGELSQNIPNPFSNITTIYYKLFESGLVHIKVFNHLGIEVKAINKAVKEKGLHKVELNANDLPHGIYYYSLLINGKLSDTKKMIVIK